MGIFEKFKQFRETRMKQTFEKYGETLKNLVTTKEQRLEAIEALGKAPAEIAIPQLLKRFDLVIEHGIQDIREKEMVVELISRFKDISQPLVREAVAKCRRVSWPIKLAEKIFSKEEYLEILLSNLREDFVEFDEAQQERNTEILLALKEVRDPRIVPKASVLVKNRDESVRMAALECLEAQADTYADAREALLALLQEPLNDDNSRFLGLVRSIVQRHNWS